MRNSVKCKTLSESSLYLLYFSFQNYFDFYPCAEKTSQPCSNDMFSKQEDFVGVILDFSREQLCGIKAISAKPGPQSDNTEYHKFMLLTTWRPLSASVKSTKGEVTHSSHRGSAEIEKDHQPICSSVYVRNLNVFLLKVTPQNISNQAMPLDRNISIQKQRRETL